MNGVWKTKDGRLIPMREMSDSHLVNTIRFLERAHARYVTDALENVPCFQGEMAQYYADQEWASAMSSTPADLFPSYVELLEEHKRRRLAKLAAESPP